MNSNNRLVYNTIVVYAQLVISMIVGLFTIRFVLQSLGEESYGVYMVVGGIVAMLDVFTACLSGASMRFIANSLGFGDVNSTQKTFTNVMTIHLVFGLLLIFVLEIGGYIMFEYILNIPSEQISSAKIVYQFMVMTSFITMVAVPFDAVINAHENLLFLSIITIGGNILMLISGIYLAYFCQFDKLVFYGLLVMIINVGQILLKAIYSNIHYKECVFRPYAYFEWNFIKPILSFIGWDFIISSVSIASSQIKSLIINVFFGVRLNAGQGIATQVNARVNQLSIGITRSITPQMNKSEGAGDRGRLIKLTKIGVKYTSFMFIVVAVPIMIEINYIFKIWLGTIPTYAVIFCQLIMINQIVSKFTWQLGNAIRAVGDIKQISIVESFLTICSVFLILVLLYTGFGAIWIYIVDIIVSITTGVLRLIIANKLVGIKPYDYIKTTIYPILLTMVIPLLLSLLLHLSMNEGLLRLIFVCTLFMSLYLISFVVFGLPKQERTALVESVLGLLTRKS